MKSFFSKEELQKSKWIKYEDLIKGNQEKIELKTQEELKEIGIECHWYLYRQLRERYKIDKNLKGIQKNKTEWDLITEKGRKKI